MLVALAANRRLPVRMPRRIQERVFRHMVGAADIRDNGLVGTENPVIDIRPQKALAARVHEIGKESPDLDLGRGIQGRDGIGLAGKQARHDDREATRRDDEASSDTGLRRRKVGNKAHPMKLGRDPAGIRRPDGLDRNDLRRISWSDDVARLAIPPVEIKETATGDSRESASLFESVRAMPVDERLLVTLVGEECPAKRHGQLYGPADPFDDRVHAPAEPRMAGEVRLRARIFAADAEIPTPGGMDGRDRIPGLLRPCAVRNDDPEPRQDGAGRRSVGRIDFHGAPSQGEKATGGRIFRQRGRIYVTVTPSLGLSVFFRMRIPLFIAASAAAALIPSWAHAAAVPGTLVKGSGDAVYAIGPNGKRFVFPTAKTYLSWFAGFDDVQTLSNDSLSAIPLGGNVTYRPGIRLVKVTTDPRVYAVAGGGILRWIENEATAIQLYGEDWAKKVDDLPDAFFVNYRIGTSISNADTYSPQTEIAAVPTIVADILARSPSTPPQTPPVTTPTSTPPTAPASSTSTEPMPDEAFLFSISATSGQPGDTINLNAQRIQPDTLAIQLSVDGVSVNNCPSVVCVGEFRIPSTNGKASYRATATIQRIGAPDITRSLDFSRVAIETKFVQLDSLPASLLSGEVLGVRAITDLEAGVSRTDILVDGASMQACVTDEHTCVWGGTIIRPSGSTVTVQAITTDPIGRRYASPTSTVLVQ